MRSVAIGCLLLAVCAGKEASAGDGKQAPTGAASAPVASPPSGAPRGTATAPAAAAPPRAAPPRAARTARASDQLAELGYYGDKAAEESPPERPCPGAADGRELVGTALPEWHLAGWANTDGTPLSLARLRGRVVVVRFWTTGCAYCEKTMPALQRLSEELRGQPVTFIGAFHAKPEGSARDLTRPLAVTRGWGITFPLAIDREWRTLRAWWLDGFHRHATSATFVIGKDGRVVHVHPGPVYYPTDDPSDTDANRDYAALRAAIVAAAKK